MVTSKPRIRKPAKRLYESSSDDDESNLPRPPPVKLIKGGFQTRYNYSFSFFMCILLRLFSEIHSQPEIYKNGVCTPRGTVTC